jgi:anti-sigma regulatory factor (Ser/Thr protein kinase)
MSDTHTGLLITLPAKPENVAVVRHAVAGLAERMGMEEPGVGDLKTVVTEASMNVVVHAYGDDEEPGPLQVEAFEEEGGLTVTVRDFGEGIRPRPEVDRPSLRIGLTLIAALSSSFEISGGLGRGTEITMRLPLSSGDGAGWPEDARSEVVAVDGAELTISAPEMVAPVLGRVVGALAARRQITVDRISDAALLTDAIAERAPLAFGDDQVSLSVSDEADGIDLRIGPLAAGASKALLDGLAIPEVGGTLESLADELRIEEAEGDEYLFVRFAALAA